MIRVLIENQSMYSWLIKMPEIRAQYVEEYVAEYINDLFDIDYNTDYFNYVFSTASEYDRVRGEIDSSPDYKMIRKSENYSEYASTHCKYPHIVSMIADYEKSQYSLSVSISNLKMYANRVTDKELIRLYNDNDKVLITVLNKDNAERNG